MKRFIIALLGVFLGLGAAFAQTSSTRATLEAQNNVVIIPNGVGSITGAKLNGMLGNMIASTGTLLDKNVFAAIQTFSLSPVIPTLPANTNTTQAASTAFVLNQIAAQTATLIPGTTPVAPSTNGGVLYDNNGFLGDSATLPSALTLPGLTVSASPIFSSLNVAGAICNSSSGLISTTTGKCAGSDPSDVSSVFGRTGAVVATSGDYSVGQVTGAAPSANPTFTGSVTATGLITLPDLATQAANTALVNATSGTASPTAQAMPGCSSASSALNWTTNVGTGCNTSITAAAVPVGGLTGAGTGVITSLGNAINASGGIVSPTPAAAGDLIYWNGSAWTKFAGNSTGTQFLQENASGAPAWATVAGSGTVTSIIAGAGLTGGTITTSGTIASVFEPGTIANCILAGTVSANALTVALQVPGGGNPSSTNPCVVSFRNVTQATGDYTAVLVTAATTFSTGTSGSTFGSSNGVPFRLWITAWNNAGTVVLGVSNQSISTQVFPINEGAPQSSTACSACTTAATAGVYYTTAAQTSKALRILGYMDWASGLTTAGTYASGPTAIQLMGPGVYKPGDTVQTVAAQSTATVSSSSTTKVQANPSVAISPISAVDLVQIDVQGNIEQVSAGVACMAEVSRSTIFTAPPTASITQFNAGTGAPAGVSLFALDKPGTTSSTTYVPFLWTGASGTCTWNGVVLSGSPQSTIVVREIMGAVEPANDNGSWKKTA